MLLSVIFFELMLFFSYVFYRFLGDRYKLRMNNKIFNKHITDITDLLIYGIIVYLFIFLKNNEFYFDIEYIIIYFISLTIFGFVLEIPGVAKSLPNFKSWNCNKLIAIVGLLLITYILGKEIFTVNKRNITLFIYLLTTLLIACIASYHKNKFKTFHPHHWQIFWFISLVVVPISYSTKILSAMYLSFFAHGVISYSAASIIKDD